MAQCGIIRITLVLIVILLYPVMTAQALVVTGESTETATVTGGVTVTYSGTGGQGGTGGGGGGGGGLSGENFTNIELNEKYFLYIYKDRVTSYRFTGSVNPVLFVNITGNASPGEIRTSVEVLRDTSTLVKEPAPGIVYKNANIWVGTSGFAMPRNIKQAVIRFRVGNSWLSGNGLSGTDIRMYKWEEGAWAGLETRAEGSDETYSYFEARTGSFSSFAISGIKSANVPETSIPENPAGVSGTTPASDASDTATPESPGFEIGAVIAAVILVMALQPGRRKN